MIRSPLPNRSAARWLRKEDRPSVDRELLVVELERRLGECCLRRDAGVVDQDVETRAAVRSELGVEALEHLGAVTEGLERLSEHEGIATKALDRLSRLIRGGLVASVVDGDERTVGREPHRDAAPDPARGSRYQSRPASQSTHLGSFL